MHDALNGRETDKDGLDPSLAAAIDALPDRAFDRKMNHVYTQAQLDAIQFAGEHGKDFRSFAVWFNEHFGTNLKRETLRIKYRRMAGEV